MSKTVFEQLQHHIMTEPMLERVLNSAKSADYRTITKEAQQRALWDKFESSVDSMREVDDTHFSFFFPIEFIPRSNRKKFRDSPFYKKYIPYATILSNPDLFDRAPLFMIGDTQIFTNIWVYAHDDMTEVSFIIGDTFDPSLERNVITKKELDQLFVNQSLITCWFIPNNSIYTRRNIPDATLKNYVENNSGFTFDTQFVADIPNKSDRFKETPISPDTSFDKNVGLVAATLHENQYFRWTILNVSQIENGSSLGRCHIDKNMVKSKKVNIRIFELPNVDILIKKDNTMLLDLQFGNDEPYFGIANAPIMQFGIKRATNGGEIKIIDRMINVSYPGHVKMEDIAPEGTTEHVRIGIIPRLIESKRTPASGLYPAHIHDRASLYIDYDKTNVHTGFKNEKYIFNQNNAIYYEYSKRFGTNNLPNEIMDYSGLSFEYDIDDYEKSSYYTSSDKVMSYKYKAHRMLDVIRTDPYYYSQYLRALIGPPESFIVYNSKVDMQGRKRSNNHTEVRDPAQRQTFATAHYLYTFRRDNNYTKQIFTFNGKNVIPKIFNTEMYTYCYFDEKDLFPLGGLIQEKNMMEIEKIYNFSQDVDLSKIKLDMIDTLSGLRKIALDSDQRITPRDIYVGVQLTDNNIRFVPKIFNDQICYHLYYQQKDGTLMDVAIDSDYIHYPELYVRLNRENIERYLQSIGDNDPVGNRFYAYIDKIHIASIVKGSNTLQYDGRLNPNPKNLQIFKNGLLVPDSACNIYFDKHNINGPHQFKANVSANPSDTFTFVYSHISREKVYESKTIPLNGYIDLENKINKPLSLQWYDFYLNGIKLNQNQLIFLTPFKLLVTGSKSVKNFIIYQKGLDQDQGDNAQVLKHNLGDKQNLYKSPADTWVSKYEWIRQYLTFQGTNIDILPDILLDLVVDIYSFLKTHLKKDWGLLNPDEQQITDDMIARNPTVFAQGRSHIFVDPDIPQNFDRNYFMDPDTQQNIV